MHSINLVPRSLFRLFGVPRPLSQTLFQTMPTPQRSAIGSQIDVASQYIPFLDVVSAPFWAPVSPLLCCAAVTRNLSVLPPISLRRLKKDRTVIPRPFIASGTYESHAWGQSLPGAKPGPLQTARAAAGRQLGSSGYYAFAHSVPAAIAALLKQQQRHRHQPSDGTSPNKEDRQADGAEVLQAAVLSR